MAEKITAEEIIDLRPCWRPEDIRVAAGTGVTLYQIATARDVSVSHRRWVLTRLASRTDAGRRALVLWAADCAQGVRHLIPRGEARDAADCAIQAAVAWVEAYVEPLVLRAAAYHAVSHHLRLNDKAVYAALAAANAARTAEDARERSVAATAAWSDAYADYANDALADRPRRQSRTLVALAKMLEDL